MTAGQPSVLLGILRLASGRPDGMAQFGNSQQAFLSSLAPLIAFPLVGSLLLLLSGHGTEALVDLLSTLVALLAPPVLSHGLARWWGREAAWLRYATAFNWCQWAIPMAAATLLLLLGAGLMAGLPSGVAGGVVVLGLAAYGLWLHWFLGRHGLGLSWLRSVALVVVVNAGTVILAFGPRLLTGL